jgi:hypothetical protein
MLAQAQGLAQTAAALLLLHLLLAGHAVLPAALPILLRG